MTIRLLRRMREAERGAELVEMALVFPLLMLLLLGAADSLEGMTSRVQGRAHE